MWYKLEGKNPVPIDGDCRREDEVTHKRVALDHLDNGYIVSTVFMGLDHGDGVTLEVFETMVFPEGSWFDLDCERYATWKSAERGHIDMVDKWSKMESGKSYG